MATYTLISSNVLASSAASVTFSAIPVTYTDLVLRISGRSTNTSTTDGIAFTINSTAGTAYSFTTLRGSGAAVSSGRLGSYSGIETSPTGVVGANATANTFGSIEIYIPSYTASQNKPFSFFGAGENNVTDPVYIAAFANLWSNTSTINRVDIAPNSATSFVSGSSFYLYGI
jgi:hypothetical protein